MASFWDATGVTPAGTYRVPLDVSGVGGASRVTVQQLADLATLVGTTHNALGSINTNTAIDLSAGPYVSATIAGALTFTFTNPPASPNGCEWTLILTNGGSAVITWPGSVTWAGATAPTLTASGVDVLHFATGNGGTNWYGWTELDEPIVAATTTTAGKVELATVAECEAGTDTARATTPEGVAAAIAALAGTSNTKWIGAGELIPRVTNGAGIDGEELATNDINLDYLAFDSATAEYAQVGFAWPGAYTTCTATFYWTAASGSGGVRWSASARCYADDDALDQAQGTAQAVSDTLTAANDHDKSSPTSAITPAGTVASGNFCVVEASRQPSHGDDTLAVDARLKGVLLEFA